MSLFDSIANKRYTVNLPLKWFIDIDVIEKQNVVTKRAISFQKLSTFSVNYIKFIEKQLILVEGTYIYYICLHF